MSTTRPSRDRVYDVLYMYSLANTGEIAEVAPEIDYLIVCDSAQVVNGKLYVLGGSVNLLARPVPIGGETPAGPCGFAVALGVKVPWLEANDQIGIKLTVEDPDERQVYLGVEGTLVTGRGPQQPKATPILAPIVLGPLQLAFPATGDYVIHAQITGPTTGPNQDERKNIAVIDVPVAQPSQSPQS